MSKLEREKYQLYLCVKNIAPDITQLEVAALRRAAITLHTWYENECNGVIQREGDDGEGAPYYWYSTVTYKRIGRAPDREKGAIKRIAAICAKHGLHYYLQTDPRGGTLYIDTKPIADNAYNRAMFVA